MKINAVKIFAGIVTIAVTIVVILGFVMAGSPNTARARNADQSRTDSLQQITGALDNYWNTNKAMPANLEVLRSSPNIYIQNINDPKTGELYGYRSVSGTAYELCATFETKGNQPVEYASPVKPMGSGPYDRIMNHDVGYQCFQFKINKWNEPTMKY
ncbi:hypothetical protein HZC53_03360 [Candidatus Uhrbacteria bacterium]|nr:hypothetical protein [Candidatus Uhrbacteria bacterium]